MWHSGAHVVGNHVTVSIYTQIHMHLSTDMHTHHVTHVMDDYTNFCYSKTCTDQTVVARSSTSIVSRQSDAATEEDKPHAAGAAWSARDRPEGPAGLGCKLHGQLAACRAGRGARVSSCVHATCARLHTGVNLSIRCTVGNRVAHGLCSVPTMAMITLDR